MKNGRRFTLPARTKRCLLGLSNEEVLKSLRMT